MKKNDEIRLTIEDMGVNGEGIGKYDGMPFFVPNAVIGDKIVAGITKLKKHYGYARLISIEEPSPDRVEPRCPLAGKCGGCSLMALSYEKQLEWKESQVYNALHRIGGISEDILQKVKRPIVGMDEPYHFRNKSQYPVGTDKDGNVVIGFYAPHSHRIVPIVKGKSGVGRQSKQMDGQGGDGGIENAIGCQIASPLDVTILNAVLQYMEEAGVAPYDEMTGRGLLRHILTRRGFATREMMVCLVVNGARLPEEERLVEQLSEACPHITSIILNTNTRRDNVILGKKTRTVWGADAIRDVLMGNEYLISARSFYQVNPVQTAKLYQKAIEYAGLTGEEVVWDLYCGIGTIGLSMAQNAKQVIGIEVVPEAVRDAEENVRVNGIENVRFVEGKAEDVLASSIFPKPDVIVVDPPRKGLDEITVQTMLSVEPERIVYVSCNPATLARDLKVLRDGGYEMVEYTPYDQFGYSSHVETVVLLSRNV